MSESHFKYILRLGDDSLILGQRLSEWIGHSPSVEVDLSLANMALDLIGQAKLLLDHAGSLEGKGRDGDQLAFHRDVFDFQNCLLVEQPNGDFARTIARQFLYSNWQVLTFERLVQSADRSLAGIAAKAVKEVAYHRDLACEWVVRLGDGTKESRSRMLEGLGWNARFVDELFLNDAVSLEMTECGVGFDPAEVREEYDMRVSAALLEGTLPPLPAHRPILGGRVGNHGEHLGHILAELQFLPRAYPDASW
jgi:ring-1,2-phenylacetyl-CoA epoxidase subunit PaaC